MRLKQQFINRLAMTSESFWATFDHRTLNDNSRRVLFRKVRTLWFADVEWQGLVFTVSKFTSSSVHLHNSVAGCKVNLILPLDQLIHLQTAINA